MNATTEVSPCQATARVAIINTHSAELPEPSAQLLSASWARTGSLIWEEEEVFCPWAKASAAPAVSAGVAGSAFHTGRQIGKETHPTAEVVSSVWGNDRSCTLCQEWSAPPMLRTGLQTCVVLACCQSAELKNCTSLWEY